ncbi:MAG: peptidyl-prolyl cis-trans isomerase, partial [Rhizobiales bacterium]|nr:peptidyl-prolyl cis-trans isomerase [Hyphomicrobiales bacterium]
APNGGALGWIAKGEMVPAFESVVFSTPPGQISQPFQTQYGWHIVKVYAKDPNRAMTSEQITAVQTQVLQEWVQTNRSGMKITSEAVPTPTPAVETFQPPADAPPTPTATVEPAASPVASPVAASPIASPVVSPIASPAASPAA